MKNIGWQIIIQSLYINKDAAEVYYPYQMVNKYCGSRL